MPVGLSKPPSFGVNRELLAWAAGVFEGEGSFSTHNKNRPGAPRPVRDRGMNAKVKMADEDVIRQFYAVVGVGSVTGPYPCDGAGSKLLWVWQVGSFEGVQHVMTVLWPWLKQRRRAKIKALLQQYHSTPINRPWGASGKTN